MFATSAELYATQICASVGSTRGSAWVGLCRVGSGFANVIYFGVRLANDCRSGRVQFLLLTTGRVQFSAGRDGSQSRK